MSRWQGWPWAIEAELLGRPAKNKFVLKRTLWNWTRRSVRFISRHVPTDISKAITSRKPNLLLSTDNDITGIVTSQVQVLTRRSCYGNWHGRLRRLTTWFALEGVFTVFTGRHNDTKSAVEAASFLLPLHFLRDRHESFFHPNQVMFNSLMQSRVF